MTDRIKKRFLDFYAKNGVIIAACKFANIDPTTYRKCLARDPDFRQAFEDADLSYAEMLETEMIKRGVKGVAEDIFDHKGKKVGERIKYSDPNLRRAVEARHKRYQARVEHNLKLSGSGVLIVPAVPASVEDWQKTYTDKRVEAPPVVTPTPERRFEADLSGTLPKRN